MKNFELVKEEIAKITEPILNENGLTIYELNNLHDFEGDVIQILIEDMKMPNKALDFDRIMLVNEKISIALDSISSLEESYLLEVASAGIEKKIKTQEILISSINQYIHIQFNDGKTVEGTLKAYSPDEKTFEMTYFLKGQIKKIKFSWKDIRFARFAVKI